MPNDDGKKPNQAWSIAARTMGVASAWIVGPVLIGLLIGKWLDQKYSTGPLLMVISLAACFLISMFGIVRGALKEFKKIEAAEKEEKEKM
ncbi:MAG: AtpZ/AtpI family protein [Candidatus Falkowbacteria bacterium]|nr:AtpZ/AtpI family protein [Candidatus Falkowbacteria bacterium]